MQLLDRRLPCPIGAPRQRHPLPVSAQFRLALSILLGMVRAAVVRCSRVASGRARQLIAAKPGWFLLGAWLCAGSATGCQLALGGVEIQPVNSSVQKPSNVAIYVSVSDADQPLTGLDENNFQVFENDILIDRSQSQLTLLDRGKVALHHTLLLVDLSGKLEESEQNQLTKALESFVIELTKTQSVAVFAFDGGEKIWKLGEFERGQTDAVSFKDLKGGDPSRNLHGAVVAALQQLDANLMRIKKPIRVGTLAVFARGPDVAGRQSIDAVQTSIEESAHTVVTLGLEGEDTAYIDDIGRSGNVKTTSMTSIVQGFEELAKRLNADYGGYYLVQYCSPARAGTPSMRLEVRDTTKQGEQRSGDLELAFNASGFGPGCNPKATPKFKTSLKDPWEINAEPEPEATSAPAPAKQPASDSRSAPSSGTPAEAGPQPSGEQHEEDEDAIVPPPDKPGYE